MRRNGKINEDLQTTAEINSVCVQAVVNVLNASHLL